MLSFINDYAEGAHEKIIQRLTETNLYHTVGYGGDEYCAAAKEKIRRACRCGDADIFFLVGGTQTNQLAIDSLLESYQGAVCAETGHINTHESGAVEFTGHKVIPLPSHEGKLKAGDLKSYMVSLLEDETFEHQVIPGLVYISHPTELGTLYSRRELQALREVCDEYQLKLYMDGARLGYGLASPASDLTLPDIAELTDAFYIGGTKVGALFGEALVYTKHNLPKHLLSRVKQHGALLAKGRLLGIQFDTLFTDGLYLEIGRHALRLAERLKEAFRERGYEFFADSPTNQIFVIMDNEKLEELEKEVMISVWARVDEKRTAVRFVTDWATTDADVDALIKIL
ncbi:MAG: threonine aldolase family protein [Candidatus Limivicinus sp.]|jgi:threonine aldolase